MSAVKQGPVWTPVDLRAAYRLLLQDVLVFVAAAGEVRLTRDEDGSATFWLHDEPWFDHEVCYDLMPLVRQLPGPEGLSWVITDDGRLEAALLLPWLEQSVPEGTDLVARGAEAVRRLEAARAAGVPGSSWS